MSLILPAGLLLPPPGAKFDATNERITRALIERWAKAVEAAVLAVNTRVDNLPGGGGTGDTTPASITIDPSPVYLWAGMTQTLTATVLNAGGTEITGETVTWSSSDTGVVTVNTSGICTPIASGTATITATDGSITQDVAVTVIAGPDLWLSGQDIDTADGVAMDSWPAREAAGGVNVTQSSSARPIARLTSTTLMHNLPAAQFDGVDDCFSNSGLTKWGQYSGRSGLTVFVVAQLDSAPSNKGGLISTDSGNTSDRGWAIAFTAGGAPQFWVPTSTSAQTVRTGSSNRKGLASVVRGRYDGGAGELSVWVNGANDDGTIAGSVPATIATNGSGNFIGKDGWSGEQLKGYMGDVLLFNTALSDAECAAVEAFLKDKYAIV